MNVLIVGAGDVGLVYGHHFAKSGHQVTFLVKEKYQQALEEQKQSGIVLYHLNRDKKLNDPQYLKNYQTINNWGQAQDFDLIVLAISSNALRQLPLDQINQQLLKPEAKLLMLQASKTDFEHLSGAIPKDKIFQGMISLISYQSNKIHSDIKPIGTAYYLMPIPMPISASIARAQCTSSQKNHLSEIVTLFKGSGIRAKPANSAIDESLLPSAFLMTSLCVLEAANWEFKRLSQSPELLKQLSTAQQALLPEYVSNSILASLIKLPLRPSVYKLLLKIAPSVVPLPFEDFLKKHFLKVREQTVIYMQEYNDLYPSNELAELNQLLHPQSN